MSEGLVKTLDDLRDSVTEANRWFDILAFEQEAFPCGGDVVGTYLAGELTFMQETLDRLTLDIRTLPLEDVA